MFFLFLTFLLHFLLSLETTPCFTAIIVLVVFVGGRVIIHGNKLHDNMSISCYCTFHVTRQYDLTLFVQLTILKQHDKGNVISFF
jgi:hypothetical protein